MPDPYASLVQLKAELGITDLARDTILTRKLKAASRAVNGYCKRVEDGFWLAETATTRVFDMAGRLDETGRTVWVDDIGSLTDLAIGTGTAGAFTAVTGFDTTVGNQLAGGRAIESIYLPGGWPSWSGLQLQVTARWGWPAVPDDVVEATIIEAVRLYKRKDTPEGVFGSADWGAVRMTRYDPDYVSLLQPYVRQVC